MQPNEKAFSMFLCNGFQKIETI